MVTMKSQIEFKFKERLRQLRLQNGLTMNGLADALGMSHKNIIMYERGTQVPNMPIIVTLAKFFNVTCEFLVGYKD